MKNAIYTLYLVLIFIDVFAQKRAEKEEWQSLFNGKDLTGWDLKISGHEINDNYKNTFLVENGMMRVNYKEYQNFDAKYGHIYYKTPYSHYRVRFEYRFQGNQVSGGASWNVRNSGIMLHSQSAASNGKDQDFPVSLEMQLLGGLSTGNRATGNLCTPGTIVDIDGKLRTAHCIDSDSKTYDGDQWVKAEAIVLGSSLVHHLIEGDTVLTYQNAKIGGGFLGKSYDFATDKVPNGKEWAKKNGTLLGEGYIALQAESHAIDFRNIELLNLKGCMNKKARNYKSYYVETDNSACVYGKKKQ